MTNKLEIALTEANGQSVSLKSMSASALESFIQTVKSLKELALSTTNDENLSFSIVEGSAQCEVSTDKDQIMKHVYDEIEIAMKGQSRNKIVTSCLRDIQSQFKKETFHFRFVFSGSDIGGGKVEIHKRLSQVKTIRLRRHSKPNSYGVKCIKGFLNEIGGSNPNYHFDYGNGLKEKISCTQEQTKELIKHLYQNINVIVLFKKDTATNEYLSYHHKEILSDKDYNRLNKFLIRYNSESDILKKLESFYLLFDQLYSSSKEDAIQTLGILLNAFNSTSHELSELKTLLLVSQSFKDHALISNHRQSLLNTYQNLKSTL